jgi:hypothetical protein
MSAHELGDHFTRYALNLRFRYRREAERSYRPEHGWIRDLHTQGAWVELPERLATRSVLAIALDTPAGKLPLVAHVAWTCPTLRDAPYLHGFRFTGITSACRDRLRGLLARETPRVPIRLYCSLAATCRQRGNGCPAVAGTIRDLGESGACVRLPDRVPPGTALQISTHTLYGPITADAEVVWADPPARLPRGASYRHGLRFLRLHPASDLPLRALLDGLR